MKPIDINGATNKVWQATKKINWYGEKPVKFDRYPLNTKLGPAYLKFKYPDDEGPFNYLIAVEHPMGFDLGTELLHFNVFDNYIVGKDMAVAESYRDNGYRIGEILRLSSIMMLIKNNFDNIKIYATNPSVLFQAKYKFEPNITRPGERLDALSAVFNNKREPNIDKLKLFAYKTYEEAKKIDFADVDNPRNPILYDRTNRILTNFMRQIFRNGRTITPSRQPFNMGMDMILTKDSVIQHRDFYNKLYKQHDIDFQI